MDANDRRLAGHNENRNRYPPEKLEKYRGQYVAWSLDGTRILASDEDPLVLAAKMKAAGYAGGEFVHSFVDEY